jgi:alcohol dehydrogenase YqhD (iron-dependent ADH family)
MDPFVYESLPSRVIFGSGTRDRLGAEIDRLGLRRVLVLSTPPQRADAEKLAASLGGRVAGVFAEAAMHTPVDVTERVMAQVAARQVDGTVAVGGGSTTGLGKAIALRTDLPQIVLPTTYAGSEMTPILGETREGRKTTQRSAKVLPEVVIYDVDLTMTLPQALSATSGMNAIAHAVEALYSPDRNPIVSLMADEAITALGRALPIIMADPADRLARSDALYGAWLCGCSALSAWHCTTSSATRWAGPSTCRMPRPTPSCCRTRLPTTPRRRRTPWRASPARWERRMLRPAPMISPAASAPGARCAISACPRTASISRPTWRRRVPIPTRGRSSGPRSAT